MTPGGDTARPIAPAPAPVPVTLAHEPLHDAGGRRSGVRARVTAHLREWRPVYLAALISRLLVLVVGFGAELAMRITHHDPATWRPFVHAETFPHYADVVTHGYTLHNATEYPLLPMLMSAGRAIGIPMSLTAMAVSNVCFVLGLVGVTIIGERFVGRDAAVRAATYLAVAPFAYWFSVASTESLLLALLAGSVLLALRATPGAWLGAGALAAAAAIARPPGAFVALVLLAIAVAQLRSGRLGVRGAGLRATLAALAAGAMVPLAVLAFFAFLRDRTGDALAAVHAQDQFHRHVSLDGPARAIASGVRSAAAGSPGQAIELLATFGAAALLVWFAATAAGNRWEVRGWTLFGAASLLLPLASGVLWQMPRFALLLPPVFWTLGRLGGPHRWLHRAVLVAFPVALVVKVAAAVVGVAG